MNDIDRLLSYWLEPVPTSEAEVEGKKAFWFQGSADIDRDIRERFGALVERARRGDLDAWIESPRGTLALIILIDQFSRNLYRGTPAAFACDPLALGLARQGYESGRFRDFGTLEHLFAAMPFRHAEDIETQKRAVALAVGDALHAEPHLKSLCVYSVDWARKHLDVVVRFGRFPHRNVALGRSSTPEELEYLAYLKAAGQWL
jgi:uncharacterized protein (DUF924 family)